jgi:threonine dehydratase
MKNLLSLERIELASRIIDPVFRDSPLVIRHHELDLQAGASLVVKIETLNPIRSFKGRGADFFVQRLAKGVPPLVTASAGNFGQGLAYAARRIASPLTVFAARTASPVKLSAMRRLGAQVRLGGSDLDGAKAIARAYADAEGMFFVEDGAQPALAEGAGTIAYELTRAGCTVDSVIVPLGNGALLTGIGAWMKHASPKTRVIGVVAAGAPAMRLSFCEDRIAETDRVDTIADGIAVRLPIPFALETMRSTVDEVLEVNDEAMLQAMRLVHRVLRLAVEPAGVAGLAAVLSYASRFRGQRIATVLCGGNLSTQQLRKWLPERAPANRKQRAARVSPK